MPNVYTVKDYVLFSCGVNGTASTLGKSSLSDSDISDKLGVDVIIPDSSDGTGILYIFPIKTDEGDGGGLSNYVRIAKSSNTLSLYVCDGTNSTEITHQNATTSGSKGPVLHYIKIGTYVCIGISTGSITQMDVVLDLKNHVIAFNQYNSSTNVSVFKFVNGSGETATFNPSAYVDATTAVSLAPILVPELGLVYDDLFTAFNMRASNTIQQYIINDESFFASGNPNTNSSTAPQFVVGEALGGAA